VGGTWDTPQQWQNFAALLSAGISAVRDSLPPEIQPKIILHVAEGGSRSTCRWFFDHLLALGMDFDVIGLSYYPWWHGPLDSLQANLNDLAVTYNKELQVLETGYPWTLAWNDGEHNVVGLPEQLLPEYPATSQGQAAFLRNVREVALAVPDELCTAVLCWEPAWVSAPSFGSPWENVALFGFDDAALPALDALSLTSTNRSVSSPARIVVTEPYPNPFDAVARGSVFLPRTAHLTIDMFDLLGRKCATIFDGQCGPGEVPFVLDGALLPSGTYLLKVSSLNASECRRVVLLR
jgi:hypothetical protein